MNSKAGAREVWWINSRVDVRLTAAETDGHLGMWTWDALRGAAAPMHRHEREDEQFLMLEGTARFVVDGTDFEAGPGDLVNLPRGSVHGYVVISETARVLTTVTPGGFEGFFTDLGTPVVPGDAPAPPPAPPTMAAISQERYSVEILGPPPALD